MRTLTKAVSELRGSFLGELGLPAPLPCSARVGPWTFLPGLLFSEPSSEATLREALTSAFDEGRDPLRLRATEDARRQPSARN